MEITHNDTTKHIWSAKNKKEIPDFEGRKIRGYAIISKGDNPEIIDNETFIVPSQSGNGKYTVKLYRNKASCSCPDYQKRGIPCKHIYSVRFWLKLKYQLAKQETIEIEEPAKEQKCLYCASIKIVKNGKARKKQRYYCRSCNRTFVAEKDFRKYKASGKLITLAIDLYYKGVSLRKIKHHLKQFYSFDVDHSTIYRWITHFTGLINSYAEQFTPKSSGMWNVDEQAIFSKGKQSWVWNAIDTETRFLIASVVSEGREISDARKLFQKAKEITKANPSVIITDGLQSYGRAIKKEFSTGIRDDTEHIRLESIRSHINNNKVERFHNTFRERDKTIRGFKGNKTAQIWANGFRTYYNFVRPHTTLGMTPAEKAGIVLNLGQNKWLGLIKEASKN